MTEREITMLDSKDEGRCLPRTKDAGPLRIIYFVYHFYLKKTVK